MGHIVVYRCLVLVADAYTCLRWSWFIELSLCVLFLSRPRSEGWPHHGRTFSIYLCPLSFWLTLPQRVLSTTWCCLSRLCVVFLACVHMALFLALFLSPGSSLVSWWCDQYQVASWSMQPFGRNRYGPKIGGSPPFGGGGAGSPCNTMRPGPRPSYLNAKFHIDISNCLATIHQRYRQTTVW